MDYIVLIEKFVVDSWAEGKKTPEIKKVLLAKKWPVELVEAVIDRLVKKKLEKKVEVDQDLAGLDWWSKPTWPVGDSWAKRARKKSKNKKNVLIVEKKRVSEEKKVKLKQEKIELNDNFELIKNKEEEIKKIDIKIFLPKEILVKKVIARKKVDKSLVRDLKIKELEESQMLIIQRKSLSLALLLFLIVIFALYWQKFVIK